MDGAFVVALVGRESQVLRYRQTNSLIHPIDADWSARKWAKQRFGHHALRRVAPVVEHVVDIAAALVLPAAAAQTVRDPERVLRSLVAAVFEAAVLCHAVVGLRIWVVVSAEMVMAIAVLPVLRRQRHYHRTGSPAEVELAILEPLAVAIAVAAELGSACLGQVDDLDSQADHAVVVKASPRDLLELASCLALVALVEVARVEVALAVLADRCRTSECHTAFPDSGRSNSSDQGTSGIDQWSPASTLPFQCDYGRFRYV